MIQAKELRLGNWEDIKKHITMKLFFNKSHKERYFLIAITYSTKSSPNLRDYHNLTLVSDTYPNGAMVLKIMRDSFNVDGMAILNIMEFSSKQDYEDFREDVKIEQEGTITR